jgi:hypothetical protein
MDNTGTLRGIFIAPDSGEPMAARESVEAVAGRGLRGDRYFRETGLYDRREELPDGTDVTLIESEALAALDRDYDVTLDPADTRRNVLTAGVALNHLVDARFRVGEGVFEGVRLCEPCGYMESAANAEGAVEGLVHRGGLNANVVESGEIALGDPIERER